MLSRMRVHQLISHSMIVLAPAVLALAGCQSSPPATPLPPEGFPTWTSVDSISKPSAEPNRWILAVLLESSPTHFDLSSAGGLSIAETNPYGASQLDCYPPQDLAMKRLDPMHPEAVQPVLSWNGHLNRGWVTWQVDLPPPGCRYHFIASIVESLAEWDVRSPVPSLSSTLAAPPTATIPTMPPPTAVASDWERWHEFTQFMAANVGKQQDQIQSLEDAIANMDGAAIVTVTTRVEVASSDQLAWLDANPPAACYAPLHTRQVDAANSFDERARDVPQSWTGTGFSSTEYQLSLDALARALADIQPDQDLVDAAQASCLPWLARGSGWPYSPCRILSGRYLQSVTHVDTPGRVDSALSLGCLPVPRQHLTAGPSG